MSKYIITILLTLVSIINLQAEDTRPLSGQARIDSLLTELPNAKKDTNHVNLLQQISFGLYSINPDKGIFISQ